MTESRNSLSIKIQSLSPGGFWGTTVSVSAAVVTVAAAIGVWAVRGSTLWAGWKPIVLAVIVTWVVPAIGLVPLLWADRSKSVKLAQAAQLANALRLGTAGVLALLILLALPDARVRIAFAVWMCGLYLVSLFVEMLVLVIWLKGRPDEARV